MRVKRLRPSGGTVGVVCTDPHIRRIFEITLLDRVFSLHADRDDAARTRERERVSSTGRGRPDNVSSSQRATGSADVGRLVLGGIASRFELPLDRVDDLLLAVESVLLQEPLGDTDRLETEATPTELRVRLGSFRPA